MAVAEERHFGRAAERLHMAQPPLSQQIRQLEGELGTRLFARTTRKVALTPAGEMFLERARRILGDVDAAIRDAKRAERGEVGRLSVGLSGSATYELLPSIAIAMRRLFPDVEVELHGEMITPALVDALLSGVLDVGLLRTPVRSPDLDVREIRKERLVVVLPEDHAFAHRRLVELEKLANEQFVTWIHHHTDPSSTSPMEVACRKAGFTPCVVQEVTETSTLVSLVAAGIGVAIVPESVQHLRITGAVYRPLADCTEEMGLAVASRIANPNPVVDVFLRRLPDLLRGRPAASEPAASEPAAHLRVG